jgi:hypothetical protein
MAGGFAVAAISVAFPAGAGTGQVLVNPLRQASRAIAQSPAIRHAAGLAPSSAAG